MNELDAAGEINHGKAVSIYEVHLDSWMRVPEDQNRPLTLAEIAPKLTSYARRMNFTHVELLSVAASSRRCLGRLINDLYKSEVGVIIESQDSADLDNWDCPWANEMLSYLSNDPIYRKYHHHQLTYRDGGAISGSLVLPLSHDYVTQDKKSLIARMPGDDWRKFANMRLLFANMYALPGKKLIFMGGEFGQWNPWNPATSLDWHLVRNDNAHGRLQRWVADLNHLYRSEQALQHTGFEYIESSDAELSALVLMRRNAANNEAILAAFNFTPVPRHNYRVGVPSAGFWKELINSDALDYGGSSQGNLGGVEAAPFGWHDQPHSLLVTLPPLGTVFFKKTI
jgi:1,4-alpha-glucan branching enzyme